MNKLINTNSYDRDIYVAEKNLYKSHIQAILKTAEEDKALEVVVYLQKIKKIVEDHIEKIKDGFLKLDTIAELIKGKYNNVNEIVRKFPDEWNKCLPSYGKDEIIFIQSQGYDKLIKMNIYHLLVFSFTNNSTYRFKECYIGFSNKNMEPYINFDIWIESMMGEIEECKDLNNLNTVFSNIKKHLINIYGVKKIYDLLPDVNRYGLPPSSEVLKSFNKQFNRKKVEIYLVKAGFEEITEDLISLAQTKRLLINLKDNDVKEWYGEGYDKKLENTKEKLNQLIQTLRISDKDLSNLSDVIKKYEGIG
jgi:hypothetical protein